MRFLAITCVVIGFILLLVSVAILFFSHVIGAGNPRDLMAALLFLGGAIIFFVIAWSARFGVQQRGR